MSERGRLRIGALSRRVGESPEVLRAWETRYGLVAPERTHGGLRLYSDADERRIRVMQRHIAGGLSASEAARLAKLVDDSGSLSGPSPSLADIGAALEHSFDGLDEPEAQRTLDHLFASVSLESALAEVILPFLNRLGRRWARAEVSVAQEHFASNVVGGRLRGLARGWGAGVGPRAVLACPPAERHELGLLCFGLVLRERGWRITYLGAETPMGEIAAALDDTPSVVILAAVDSQRFEDVAQQILELATLTSVAIGGAGGSSVVANRLGVAALSDDLVEAAARLVP
jgi:DNA-binding transcriptional MerR regulator